LFLIIYLEYFFSFLYCINHRCSDINSLKNVFVHLWILVYLVKICFNSETILLLPETEILLILSAIFSIYSISFNLNNILFSSINLAVFNNERVEAVSSLRMMLFACAFFSAIKTWF